MQQLKYSKEVSFMFKCLGIRNQSRNSSPKRICSNNPKQTWKKSNTNIFRFYIFSKNPKLLKSGAVLVSTMTSSIYDALTSCTRFQNTVNGAGRRDNSTQTDLLPILEKPDSEVSKIFKNEHIFISPIKTLTLTFLRVQKTHRFYRFVYYFMKSRSGTIYLFNQSQKFNYVAEILSSVRAARNQLPINFDKSPEMVYFLKFYLILNTWTRHNITRSVVTVHNFDFKSL